MTTNQTIDGVRREKIERALGAVEQVGLQDKFIDYAFVRTVKHELRALLDAEQCTSCDGSGEYIDAIGDWRGYCSCAAGVALKNKPAAQPAPVAVVLPERRAEIVSDDPALLMAVATWNACLDELKRLNPSL